MECPRCRKALTQMFRLNEVHWHCRVCTGDAVTAPLIRRVIGVQSFRAIWSATFETRGAPTLPCPGCRNRMMEIQVLESPPPLFLDICKVCHMIWFDAGERARLTQGASPPVTAPSRAAPVQEKADSVPADGLLIPPVAHPIPEPEKEARAREWQRQADLRPKRPWDGLADFFETPETAQPLASPSMIKWILLALFLTGGIFSANFPQEALTLGLRLDDPLRLWGLTWLSHLLLFTDPWHCAAVLVFGLLIFDEVEIAMGKRWFMVLFLAAAAFSALGQGTEEALQALPLAGAGGLMTGLITYYAAAFPRARVSLHSGLAGIQAWQLLVAWILVQGLLWTEPEGHLVAHQFTAHAGAAFMGLALRFMVNR